MINISSHMFVNSPHPSSPTTDDDIVITFRNTIIILLKSQTFIKGYFALLVHELRYSYKKGKY